MILLKKIGGGILGAIAIISAILEIAEKNSKQRRMIKMKVNHRISVF